MTKITKVISVDSDPKKVIEYIANVKNHPAFISALKSVDNIRGDVKSKGTTWDWTFVMAGVEIKGKAEALDHVEGKRYSFKTSGGIDSVFTYSVEPENGGSRLTLSVEYEMPNNILAKIADKAVVERLNEEEGERATENLKAILEG